MVVSVRKEKDLIDRLNSVYGKFATNRDREETIRVTQLCHDRVIYCDTDSLHFKGTDIPDILKDRIDEKWWLM